MPVASAAVVPVVAATQPGPLTVVAPLSQVSSSELDAEISTTNEHFSAADCSVYECSAAGDNPCKQCQLSFCGFHALHSAHSAQTLKDGLVSKSNWDEFNDCSVSIRLNNDNHNCSEANDMGLATTSLATLNSKKRKAGHR